MIRRVLFLFATMLICQFACAQDTIPSFDSLYILWNKNAVQKLSAYNRQSDSTRQTMPVSSIMAFYWAKPKGDSATYLIGNYWITRLSNFRSNVREESEIQYAQLMFDVGEVEARKLRKFLNEVNWNKEYSSIEMNVFIREYNANLLLRQKRLAKQLNEGRNPRRMQRVRKQIDSELHALRLYADPFYYLNREYYNEVLMPYFLEEFQKEQARE